MTTSYRYIFTFCTILLVFACKKTEVDRSYNGKNEVMLYTSNNGESAAMTQGEDSTLELTVFLTRTITSAAELHFTTSNNLFNGRPLLLLEDSIVHINAGDKTAVLQFRFEPNNNLLQSKIIVVQLQSSSSEDIIQRQVFRINTNPSIGTDTLSTQQIELLEYYKSNYQLDLYPLMGVLPVTAVVHSPGNGFYAPFLEPYTRTLHSNTSITLSELSTRSNPILKMTHNAMGLRNYFYEVLRATTVLNTDYWTGQPPPQVVMSLVNLSPNSEESFEVALDNIQINPQTKDINYVKDIVNPTDTTTTMFGIPFQYTYSAWNRLLKLIGEGNQDAIQANGEGGTLNPAAYMNVTSIDSGDPYGTGSWVKSTGKLTSSDLEFFFIGDHADAGDFSRYDVKISLNANKK